MLIALVEKGGGGGEWGELELELIAPRTLSKR